MLRNDLSARPRHHPYVSIAFVCRNDGYGGDLEARIEKFIAYYGYYAKRHPGLYEFVICDWNPPATRPPLRAAFPWHELGDVLHVEVPSDVHERLGGPGARPMLDYIGRNVAMRRGRGTYVLVLNQDIFVSESILDLIAKRALQDNTFYRADRCDFDFDKCRDVAASDFEAAALKSVFAVHRRHQSDNAAISTAVTADDLADNQSREEPGDTYDRSSGTIFCDAAVLKRRTDRRRARWWRWMPRSRIKMAEWHESYTSPAHYRQSYLHTNASGDFILAPRRAFDQIHGLCEAVNFYLHLDSYAIVQLFSAGYRPAIFGYPHRVYHADHDRSARADARENVTWAEHEAAFSQIMRGERPYTLNGPSWGLGDVALKMWWDDLS
jgi:GT2 family glycosyltransferase